MEKLVLSFDIDDVLLLVGEPRLDYLFRTHQPLLSREECEYYYFYQLLGCSHDEGLAIEYAFLRECAAQLSPVPGALEGLMELKRQGYILIAITARGKEFAKVTQESLDRFFPGIFSAIIHTSDWLDYWEKHIFCTKHGVAHHTDDTFSHVIGCINNGIPATLFGEYSWNQDPKKRLHLPHAPDWPILVAKITREHPLSACI